MAEATSPAPCICGTTHVPLPICACGHRKTAHRDMMGYCFMCYVSARSDLDVAAGCREYEARKSSPGSSKEGDLVEQLLLKKPDVGASPAPEPPCS